MHCPYCGLANPVEYKFCGNCGNPLNATEQPADSLLSPGDLRETAPYGPDEYVPGKPRRRKKATLLFGSVVGGAAAFVTLCVCLFGSYYLLASSPTPAAIVITPTQVSGAEVIIPSPTVRVVATRDSQPQVILPTAGVPVASATKVGPTVRAYQAGPWTLTSISTQKSKTLTLANGENRQAKGVWLFVYLTVKNTSRQGSSLGEGDFIVSDSSGIQYKPSTGYYVRTFLTNKQLATFGDPISAGVTAKAGMGFDVNTNAKGLALVYQPTDLSIGLGQ